MTEAQSHVAPQDEGETVDSKEEKFIGSNKMWMGITGLFFATTVIFIGLYATKGGDSPSPSPSPLEGAATPMMAESQQGGVQNIQPITPQQMQNCQDNANASNCPSGRWAKYKALKIAVGDFWCTQLGELHSLMRGLQLNVAASTYTTGTYNGRTGAMIRDEIENGDLDPKEIDKFWTQMVGHDANFGEFQWEMAFFFARQKMVMKHALNDVFEVMNNWITGTGNGRRLETLEEMIDEISEVTRRLALYGGDGYSNNKHGQSNVLNWMTSSNNIKRQCNNQLSTYGSGLKKSGEACSHACDDLNSLNKLCTFCGTGKCCKNGVSGDDCDGEEGGTDRYVCVSAGDTINGNRIMKLKSKIGDVVCELLGKMHSLVVGLQMAIAKQSPTTTADGYSGMELVDRIRNGDDAAAKLDQFFAEITGDDASFGNHQWDLGFFFARQKMIIQPLFNKLMDVIDAWKESYDTARRRGDGYQGDGYSDNKSGESDVIGQMLTSGEILNQCDNWLDDHGSGLEHAGEACADACVGDWNEACDYCGTGKCCKQGTSGADCDGAEGGDGRYICVTSA